jgi:hypothetical protein
MLVDLPKFAPDVAKHGVSYRQLDHWARRGWFDDFFNAPMPPEAGVRVSGNRVTAHPTPGQGFRRDWSLVTLNDVLAVALLVQIGKKPTASNCSLARILATTGEVVFSHYGGTITLKLP